MDWHLLAKSLIVGFIIAIPTGPVGVLCVRRALTHGRSAGFISGLGSATADLVYVVVVLFGLQAISHFLLQHHEALRLGGSIFLIYLGVTTFFSAPLERTGNNGAYRWTSYFTSAFLLTITNPILIVSFTALFAAYGLAGRHEHLLPAVLTALGVFIGSSMWWLLLNGVIDINRHKISESWLEWINKISGVIILLFGLLALLVIV